MKRMFTELATVLRGFRVRLLDSYDSNQPSRTMLWGFSCFHLSLCQNLWEKDKKKTWILMALEGKERSPGFDDDEAKIRNSVLLLSSEDEPGIISVRIRHIGY